MLINKSVKKPKLHKSGVFCNLKQEQQQLAEALPVQLRPFSAVVPPDFCNSLGGFGVGGWGVGGTKKTRSQNRSSGYLF